MTRALHTIESERERFRQGVTMARQISATLTRFPAAVILNVSLFERRSDNSTTNSDTLSAVLGELVKARLPELLEEADRVLLERHKAAGEELVVTAAKVAMEGI